MNLVEKYLATLHKTVARVGGRTNMMLTRRRLNAEALRASREDLKIAINLIDTLLKGVDDDRAKHVEEAARRPEAVGKAGQG